MKKVLNVKAQREIRKKQLKKKYFKVFLLFLAFFGLMLVVWQISLKRLIFKDKQQTFPILFSGDCVLDFKKNKNGFCVLTNNRLNFYAKNGEFKREVVSSSANNKIESFGEFVLCYEKGSKSYSINNQSKVLFSDVLPNNIIFGKIFKNGRYVIVTESEDFYCDLLVFDKDHKQIFYWGCAECLINDVDVFEDGNGCFVAATRFKDGFCKTFLYELKFSTNEEILKKEFEKCIPILIKKSGSIVILVCDFVTFFIDANGSVLKEVNYGRDLINFVVTNNGYFIGCFSKLDGNVIKNYLVSYDKIGNKLAEQNLDEKVKKIKEYDGDILIVTDNFLFHTNVNLKIKNQIKDLGNIDEFIYDKPYFYYVSMNKINRLLFK